MNLCVRKLNSIDNYDVKWDDFVMKQSVNGTFLQTRRFLNYHPSGRFADDSLFVCNEKDDILAVCPGAMREIDSKKCFVSHPGSSFGGVIVNKDYYRFEVVDEIISVLENYWMNNYEVVRLSLTNNLYNVISDELMQYVLNYHSFIQSTGLGMYVSFANKSIDEIANDYDKNKKRNIKKCINEGLSVHSLESDSEMEEFYMLLSKNLLKYSKEPVHTLYELLDFKNDRLKDEVSFLGIRDTKGRLVAATMYFYFEQTNALHTQYLCADLDITEYSPSSYLYHAILEDAYNRGMNMVSWGTTTEDSGRYINKGLTRNKESFGGDYELYRTFEKIYS